MREQAIRSPARRVARRGLLLALAAYTLGFAAAALAHAWPFVRDGRYFIFAGDGCTQHFPAFCYTLQYWKQYLAGLVQGQLMPALYSFSLGLGGDIFQTLHYYGLTNPFYLLALPVPEAKLPLAFSLLVVLQLYLGGLGFYAFCRRLRVPRAGAVAGAWLYVFTGFYPLCVDQPIMAHTIVFLPLVLLGCEKVLRRESPLLLAASVFGMALCGFYFLFTCSVALAFYVLLRVWAMGQRPWWRAALSGAVRSLAAYLAGLFLACPIFLPGVLAYLDSSRAGGGSAGLPALFSGLSALRSWCLNLANPARYWYLGAFGLLAAVLCLAAPRTSGQHADPIRPHGGYSPAKTPPAGALKPFAGKHPPHGPSGLDTPAPRAGRSWPLIAGFGVVALFTVSPLAQGVLVGFGDTPETRFWFVLQFLAAFAAARCWPAPAAASLTRPQLAAGAALVLLAALLFASGGGQRAQWVWLGFLLAGLLLLAAASLPRLWQRLPRAARPLRAACCVLLAALVLAQPALALYGDSAGRCYGYRGERFARQMPPVTADTLPEGEYRVDTTDVALERWWSGPNSPLVGGYKGLSEYYSILSPHYTDAMLCDWALLPAQLNHCSFRSLDSCMALDTLAAVRYTYARPGDESRVPYGFDLVGETPQAPVYTFIPESGANLLQYENRHTLPLGYAYTAAISAEQYASLNALQKQAAMLSAAALADGEVPDGFAAEPAVAGVTPLEASWQAEGGAAWQDGVLTAAPDSDESGLTLRFTLSEEAEVHLCLSGLVVEQNPAPNHCFCAMDENPSPEIFLNTFDHDACWVNLGPAGPGEHTVRLTLSQGSRFSLAGLALWGYATAAYDAAADALGQTVLQNVVVGKNSVAGLLQTETDCILGLAIPYSRGWRATIDGVQATPRRANSMFMALEIPAGEHVIGLYYITPGLKAGLILCALGVLALAAQLIWYYYKRKRGGRL